MKPIRPSDVVEAKRVAIPEAVIDVVNMLVAKHWNGHDSTFAQSELLDHLIKRMTPDSRGKRTGQTPAEYEADCRKTRAHIFAMRWLDFEEVFKAEGWRVEYDKPGYDETYAATFKFTVGK